MTFVKEPIGNFEGDSEISIRERNFFGAYDKIMEVTDAEEVDPRKHVSAINTRDAKLHHLYARASTKNSHKAHIDLSTEINKRMRTDHVFEHFTGESKQVLAQQRTTLPRNFDCLKKMITTYEKECGKMEDYDLQYVKQFVRQCELLSAEEDTDDLEIRLQKACQH